MFGYIRACKPEMRIKEFEMYKTVYCSLCKELGKSYGPFARLTLSYDFTFLALLNMSLKKDFCGTERKLCKCNPLKKCNYLKEGSDLEMPAAAAMIMLYYKLLDNIADEKGFKKIGYILIKPFFKSAHKKAAKSYPDIEKIVAEYICEQQALEKDNCQSIDKAADPTAKALAEIFALCSKNETDKRVLNRMGYCIGRYVYLLDAYCDLEEDIKKDRYNPLKFSSENIKENIAVQLNICISQTGAAMELLNIEKFKNILDNIVFLGLEDTMKKELKI
ncbi:MAG: hypothetical protein IJP21_05825 [Clostridia bacterium]|nr:hypothetical protein [Clostridia bacterium]